MLTHTVENVSYLIANWRWLLPVNLILVLYETSILSDLLPCSCVEIKGKNWIQKRLLSFECPEDKCLRVNVHKLYCVHLDVRLILALFFLPVALPCFPECQSGTGTCEADHGQLFCK